MWVKNEQKYNQLVWQAESDKQLKKILLDEMGVSVRLMVSLKKEKAVWLNNKKASVADSVKKGDIIRLNLPEEHSDYELQEMPLKIYYEDEDVLVVDKPYDQVVHPTKSHYKDTMLNGLAYYFAQNNIWSKVRFVNRLDRFTSGILVVAKNGFAHSMLTKNLSAWEMDKEYIALVQGHVKENNTIDEPIALVEDGFHREISPQGQKSVTHYQVIAANETASLLKIKLETGRTHQIRVHMASIGHPLFGDELYGGDLSYIQRQALNSTNLGFYSPRKAEKIQIKTKLPEDLRELIEKLLPDAGLDKIY